MRAARSDDWLAARALVALLAPRAEEDDEDVLTGAYLLANSLRHLRALTD